MDSVKSRGLSAVRPVPMVPSHRVGVYASIFTPITAILRGYLMNKTVFFHVNSHGYEFRKDGFGYRGQKLNVVAGEQATLSIKRPCDDKIFG